MLVAAGSPHGQINLWACRAYVGRRLTSISRGARWRGRPLLSESQRRVQYYGRAFQVPTQAPQLAACRRRAQSLTYRPAHLRSSSSHQRIITAAVLCYYCSTMAIRTPRPNLLLPSTPILLATYTSTNVNAYRLFIGVLRRNEREELSIGPWPCLRRDRTCKRNDDTHTATPH